MITGPARPLLAWIVIALVLLSVVGLREVVEPGGDDGSAKGDGVDLRTAVLELQGRYLVGVSDIVPATKGTFTEALDGLETGDLEQRIGHVVLLGEFRGAVHALIALERLRELTADSGRELTRDQALLLDRLEAAYRDHVDGRLDAPSLDARDRRFVEEELGWLGALALCPRGAPSGVFAGPPRDSPEAGGGSECRPATRRWVVKKARQTAFLVGGATVFFLGFALLGIGMLVTLAWLCAGRRIRFGVGGDRRHGGIYAETFAVWIVLFVGLSVLAELLEQGAPDFVVLAAVFFVSLVALGWPLLRGVPWARLRRDIGWTVGRRPLLEPFVGVAAYAMCLPLLIVGLLLYFMVVHLGVELGAIVGMQGGGLDPVDTPSHPVIGPFLGAGWSGRLQVYFLACVAAPVVEETMFRGVLYRHLREFTGRLGLASSAAVSAIASSFLFAVVHPQGLATVPLLMTLAIGFAIAREWRGTLIPAMVAHGLSNGLMLTMVLLLLSRS